MVTGGSHLDGCGKFYRTDSFTWVAVDGAQHLLQMSLAVGEAVEGAAKLYEE